MSDLLRPCPSTLRRCSGRASLRTSSGQALRRRTETFIVRVWAEYLEQTPPVWRGEIEHAGSGEKAHFRETADVVRFIAIPVSEAAAQREEDSQ